MTIVIYAFGKCYVLRVWKRAPAASTLAIRAKIAEAARRKAETADFLARYHANHRHDVGYRSVI